jgi:hypothetical protein
VGQHAADLLVGGLTPHTRPRGLRSPLSHPLRDWALGSSVPAPHPCPHLHQDRAHPTHICTRTVLTTQTSLSRGARCDPRCGAGQRRADLRLRPARQRLHVRAHICAGTALTPAATSAPGLRRPLSTSALGLGSPLVHICIGTAPAPVHIGARLGRPLSTSALGLDCLIPAISAPGLGAIYELGAVSAPSASDRAMRGRGEVRLAAQRASWLGLCRTVLCMGRCRAFSLHDHCRITDPRRGLGVCGAA